MHCTSCGNILSDDSKSCQSCGVPTAPTEDRAPVSSANPPGRHIPVIVFAIVVLAGIGTFISFLNPSVHRIIEQQAVVSAPADYDSNFVGMAVVAFRDETSDLVFSLGELKQSRLIRFEYRGGRTPRAIMAYIAPTGQVVTAMSVSEHCGSTTFKIKDNKIYCAQCPSNWDMMTMEAYGCCAKYFPDPIPSRVVGDDVRIPKVSVEKWAGRL